MIDRARGESLAKDEEKKGEEYLRLPEIARRLGVCRETARRLFRNEPGVEMLPTRPGARPIVLVPLSVYERVLRRSANPWPANGKVQ